MLIGVFLYYKYNKGLNTIDEIYKKQISSNNKSNIASEFEYSEFPFLLNSVNKIFNFLIISNILPFILLIKL